jgi:hypothetical protein
MPPAREGNCHRSAIVIVCSWTRSQSGAFRECCGRLHDAGGLRIRLGDARPDRIGKASRSEGTFCFISSTQAQLRCDYASSPPRYPKSRSRAGHSDMRATEIYLRVDPSEKLEAMEAVLPPSMRRGRFKAPDALIASLQGISQELSIIIRQSVIIKIFNHL